MNHEDTKEEERRMRRFSDEVELAYAVIGAAIEVHRALGAGFLERVYHEALVTEFRLRGIPHKSKHLVAVKYKDYPIGEGELDFLVGDSIIVELKAVEKLSPIHEAQVISYLKMTNCPLGLLINFNVPMLKEGIKRIILSP
jgi:GxxExxY protein